jgi:hypothetical protein
VGLSNFCKGILSICSAAYGLLESFLELLVEKIQTVNLVIDSYSTVNDINLNMIGLFELPKLNELLEFWPFYLIEVSLHFQLADVLINTLLQLSGNACQHLLLDVSFIGKT